MGGERRWKLVAVLATGLAIGVVMTGTPAGAHVAEWAHNWSTHIKPRTDARYYTKTQANARYQRKVAPSGQTFSGQLAVSKPAGQSEVVVAASFPLALPAGIATPVLEYRPGNSTSVTCPGVGKAGAGRLCLYGYSTFNIDSVGPSGGSTGENKRYGFALVAFEAVAGQEGFLLANWAYRVP